MAEVAKLVIGKIRVYLALEPGKVPGQLCALYELRSSDNYKLGTGKICIDFPAIRTAVLKTIAARGPVGWSFKKLKRKANSLAHRVSIKKIEREIMKVATDPRLQKAAAMSAAIYPPLGIPLSAAVSTAKLYQAAKAGDPNARAKVAKIITDAQAGSPAAQQLARGVAIFDAAQRKGYDVGGWADNIKKGWLVNIPYRTNLQAGELDRSRPGHIARGLYNLQLHAIARGEFPGGQRKAKKPGR